MKARFDLIRQYLLPASILAALLLTNLFTRSETLRSWLFPQRALRITVTAVDGGGAAIEDLNGDAAPADTLICDDPRMAKAREAFEHGRFDSSLAVMTRMLDSTACNRSLLLSAMVPSALRSGDRDRAENLSNDAIAADSANALAWYYRGFCFVKRNQLSPALEAFRRAIRLRPGMGRAHYALASLALRRARPAEAVSHFRDALAWGVDKGLCWYAIGLAYQRLDSAEQALAALRESVRYAPGRMQTRLKMAEVWAGMGQLDSAAHAAEDARRIDPGDAQVLLRLSRIWADKGMYDTALGLLEQADVLRPNTDDIDYERARIYGLRGDDRRALAMYQRLMARDPTNPRVYFNIGVNLMDLGRGAEAMGAYGHALSVDPSYWKAAYNIGVHFLRNDSASQAIPYLERVVELVPERSGPCYNLGLAYLRTDDLPLARRAFEQTLRLDSTHQDARYNLALSLLRDGRSDSAETVFRSLVTRDTCDAKGLYNLGLLSKRRGAYTEADSLFARAIACKRADYAAAWYGRAQCSKAQGRINEALEQARNAFTQAGSGSIGAKAMLLSAQIYDSLGLPDSARAILSLADSLAGSDPETLGDIAAFYQRRGDFEPVRAIYRRLLGAGSTDVATLLAAADAERTSGNADSAELLYGRAVESDSDNVTALLRLGEMRVQRGACSDGEQALQRALQLDPGSVRLRVGLALAYDCEKRPQEYRHELERLGRMATGAKDALDAGRALLKADKHADAMPFLEKAAARSPQDPDPLFLLLTCRSKAGLGVFDAGAEWQAFTRKFPAETRGRLAHAKVLLQNGSPRDAIAELQRALALKDFSSAHYQLARAYLALGDSLKAREQISTFIQSEPTDKKGAELYAALHPNPK